MTLIKTEAMNLKKRKGGECADMKSKKLYVRLFGKCSITCGDVQVEDNGKRASKIWLLIAFLICNRERTISQEELIKQIWSSESNVNPAGVLKTTLWRARSLLDKLWPSAGHELILNDQNGYKWNSETFMEVDAELFSEYCQTASLVNQEEKLFALRKAIELYQSDFLEKYSGETWVEPLTAYYNNLYVYSVLELLSYMKVETASEEMIDLSRTALQVSPYQEELYQYLMRGLMQQKNYKQAEEVYEELRELLYVNLGVVPSEISQELHREALRYLSRRVMTMDLLREQLQEREPVPGPLFCDFSVFRQFYQAEARSVSRRGDAVHVAMFSIVPTDGKELSENSREQIMTYLREHLRGSLRRGDVVSRCSMSQYVVLLLQANFENSIKVCERIERAYLRANPRSGVRIQSTVLPVEPLQGGGIAQRDKKYEWK